MDSIQKSCAFLNLLKPRIKKKVRNLFLFGYLALSTQRIVSLNSNARVTVANTHTAESNIYRLSKNKRILEMLPGFLKTLELVHEGDLINIDFSDFNGRHVLMFAKQTEEGRAIPLYFEFMTCPIKKGIQNPFIIETIKKFLSILGFQVRFVFDRGFALPDLIQFLAKIKATFYIRIKKDKKVELENGGKQKAKDFRNHDARVTAYELPLRLMISKKPDPEGEPWYLITNDTRRGRSTILSIYYHRFEIEEFFKDAKRIFGLEYIRVKHDSTFAILLWFVMLGMWCLWFFKRFVVNVKGRIRKLYKNGYRLSLIAYWLEWIQYEIRSKFLSQIKFSSG